MSQLILCPACKSQFVTRIDFERHLETHWRKTLKGNGETISRTTVPLLNAKLMKIGRLIEHGYRYALLGDVIYRTPHTSRY